MNASPLRPRQVTFVANACAIIALLVFSFVAEWIPHLLPYSPNLALPPAPAAIRSPLFPLVMSLLGAAGLMTWYLVRRLHRHALLSFTVFWAALMCCLVFSYVFIRRTHEVRGAIFMGFVATAGVIFWRSLKLNLPRL